MTIQKKIPGRSRAGDSLKNILQQIHNEAEHLHGRVSGELYDSTDRVINEQATLTQEPYEAANIKLLAKKALKLLEKKQ